MALQLSFLGKALLFQLPSYAVIAVAIVIGCIALSRSSAPDGACLCSALLFGGYVCIRALTSPAPYFARADLYCTLAALGAYLLVSIGLVSSSRRVALLVLLWAFAAYQVFIGFVQFGVGQNFLGLPFLSQFEQTTRASGFYSNPDQFAGLLELLGIFALSVACWSRRPKWVKVFIGAFGVICYEGLGMTVSRGGLLSAAASILTFLVLSAIVLKSGLAPEFQRYRRIALLVAVIGLATSALAIQQSSFLRERVSNLVSPDHTRFDLWRAAVAQWKLNPVFGTGSGTYRFYGREFRSPRMQADPVVVHNDYLHLLCEYGVAGCAAFALFFGVHLRAGWRSFAHYGSRRVAMGASALSDRLAFTIAGLSALAAYVVHSAVDFNLHIPANALVLSLVFGFLANPGRTHDSGDSSLPAMFLARWIAIVLAIALFVRCMVLLPGEYFGERSRIALQNDDPSLAMTFADQALAYERNNPNIFFCLGRAWGALAREEQPIEKRSTHYEQALAAFDKARLLAPLEESYPLDMAYVYDQLGRFAEGEWMYGLARDRDPRSEAIDQLYRSHLKMWRKSGTGKL